MVATPTGKRAQSKNLALVAMLFAVAMTFIDQTIVAIASPNIQSELSLSQAESRWVVNAYLLALAATFASSTPSRSRNAGAHWRSSSASAAA